MSAIFNNKTVIEVPAEYVDISNDGLKWAIVMIIAWVYNDFLSDKFGFSALANSTLRTTAITAFLITAGFALYHLVIEKLIMFVPVRGQATYYMALKRAN